MTTGISSFDTSIIKTKEWIQSVQNELHLDDEQQAYVALRAVLHVLRDRLTPNEAADFGAQLPLLLRGVYYDGWKPAGKPLKIRSQDEFLAEVSKAITQKQQPKLADPIRVSQGVIKIIEKHVTGGEMQDVRNSMTQHIQKLWPQTEEV
ncbi:MAG: DUF2267 domain-containing protein [Desulfovibrionales bacterium]